MSGVHLATFDPSRHLSILARWLSRPHVARWWGDPYQALATLKRQTSATKALIEIDSRPVGFICWQTPTQDELSAAGLSDLPADLVDIDVLIGEPDVLGQGVGPTALWQLLAKLRVEGIHLVGLAAAVANARALRAYEKAGFQPFRDFNEAGQDMRYMVQDLNNVD